MPRLVLALGTPQEVVFELPLGVTTIGRSEASGVHVLHESLSRQHAQIEVLPSFASITDLKSKNGTFVNGVKIDRAPLSSGDRVQCGDIELVFDPTMRTESISQPTMTRAATGRYSHADIRQLLLVDTRGRTSALRLKQSDRNERARDKLQILVQVSQLLSGLESVDVLFQTILDLVMDVFQVDRAVVLMVDEATGELAPIASRNSKNASDADTSYSSQIATYVKDHGVAALFADAQSDDRLNASASVAIQGIRSSMCAPFKPRDRVLGVLYVDSVSGIGHFGEEDLEFIGAFANQAGVAIENAQLHARLEQEAVMRNNLLRFFPPTTITRLHESTENALATIDAQVTALFCDISGFTALAGKMHPRAVVGLLNEYFPVMADIIFRWDGTLEKYIGDAILAVWGAPFPHDDDADRAVAAAVEMQQALETLNQRWAAENRTQLQIHIGLHSGHVAAGNIGSSRYVQYATIGDATNVASRVCSAAVGGEVFISDATKQLLTHTKVSSDLLPPIQAKGKEQPLRVHRVNWRSGVVVAGPPTERALPAFVVG